MKAVVFAMGQDQYWLTALRRASARAGFDMRTVDCPGDIAGCIGSLPQPHGAALLLVDASGHAEIAGVVDALRARGWQYVVVVAADPSSREAIAVLRKNRGYDYWKKTYDESEVRSLIEHCLAEIAADHAPDRA